MLEQIRDYTILQHGTDQLTSDRKYETVESAELPQTQLFVIDLPPNSIQRPVEHFSDQDSLTTSCQSTAVQLKVVIFKEYFSGPFLNAVNVQKQWILRMQINSVLWEVLESWIRGFYCCIIGRFASNLHTFLNHPPRAARFRLKAVWDILWA